MSTPTSFGIHTVIPRVAAFTARHAELSIGGAPREIKGKAAILSNVRYEADVHIQRAMLGHFTAPDRRADNPRMR
jgi:hypothetical protein